LLHSHPNTFKIVAVHVHL